MQPDRSETNTAEEKVFSWQPFCFLGKNEKVYFCVRFLQMQTSAIDMKLKENAGKGLKFFDMNLRWENERLGIGVPQKDVSTTRAGFNSAEVDFLIRTVLRTNLTRYLFDQT